MSTSGESAISSSQPVLGLLWRSTFWLALKTPLQMMITFVSIPLTQGAIGADVNGAYVFAGGFGFVQLLLEFGMGSALLQQMSLAWAAGDRGRVGRLINCGLTFYGVMTLIQTAILLCVASFWLPSKFHGDSRGLIVGLLWLQALSSPFFGLITVATSILQAAHRYALLPRIDLVVMVLRFVVLVVGLQRKVDFLWIIVMQTFIVITLNLLPALWVIVRELKCVPRFSIPHRAEMRSLFQVSFFIFLLQLSVVLADQVDTIILTYAITDENPGPKITLYQNVSKPYFQIRQMGWTLVVLVIPAAASMAATGDHEGVEKLKYDGTRYLIGLLLPVALLAAIYAAPFLQVWVGAVYAKDAWLLQLFLVATLPLGLAVLTKMAFGMGKFQILAICSLVGALINLPLSYFLTTRIGVAGVIWGTVLTTLISNFIVPGIYLFRLLEIKPMTFLVRSLGAPLAGAGMLTGVSWIAQEILPAAPAGASFIPRVWPLALHVSIGVIAYAMGYMCVPFGGADLRGVWTRVRRA